MATKREIISDFSNGVYALVKVAQEMNKDKAATKDDVLELILQYSKSAGEKAKKHTDELITETLT